jgi:DNA polymerase III epsilon subunit-like protein
VPTPHLPPAPAGAVGSISTELAALVDEAAVLAVDVETAGLHGSAIQLGVSMRDHRGSELHSRDELWRLPPGELIEKRAQAVHGIDAAMLEETGVDALPALRELCALVCAAVETGRCMVVAHNAAFDATRLNDTAERHGGIGRAVVEPRHVFCTMQAARGPAGLLDARGAPKNPKLLELLGALGIRPEKQIEGFKQHHALSDARATALAFQAGVRKGWWPAKPA